MTEAEIQDAVLAALFEVAPEAADAPLASDVDLREELDLDSMDFLNFVTALHGRFGLDIPERDYGKLDTLDAVVAYVSEHGRE